MDHFIHIIGGQSVSVQICRHVRARRMNLRFDSKAHALKLTVPKQVAQKQFLEFLRGAEKWILKQLSQKIAPIPFEAGLTIPLFGQPYKILHEDAFVARGVELQENTLVVHGPKEHLNEMILRFLKAHAKTTLTKFCEKYAVRSGSSINKITIRDTKSRWGSCSSQGNISLCWRLVLTPKSVAEYICAHEVAHLKEMNHSPRFWKIVKGLQPDYQESKDWLKKNGAKLFHYGSLN